MLDFLSVFLEEETSCGEGSCCVINIDDDADLGDAFLVFPDDLILKDALDLKVCARQGKVIESKVLIAAIYLDVHLDSCAQ